MSKEKRVSNLEKQLGTGKLMIKHIFYDVMLLYCHQRVSHGT